MPKSPHNRERWLVFLTGLALVLGTLASYWRVGHFGYVNLDDTLYVTDNKMVLRGLTWDGIAWAFGDMEGGNWNPLVWLSHELDCQVFGLEAGGHHLTNLFLHAANVLLLFLVLRGMTGTLWRSALASALFAWHPAHVESVAWVSERKDVLSTLFWLLTMWAYAGYTRQLKIKNSKCKIFYALALVFFVLGLMSKPMLVTLPVVLLLMDWWPLGRICDLRFTNDDLKKEQQKASKAKSSSEKVSWKQALAEKIPFFVLSAGACVVAILAQQKSEAVLSKPLLLRLENAAVSCVAYLFKFVWPANLAVLYPYPTSILWWRALGAVIILAAITMGVVWAGKQRRYLVSGWLWFLVALLPVIGLVQVGTQGMADRYIYVPYMGLGLMASWGLVDWIGERKERRVLAGAAVALALIACAALTRAQVEFWHDSETLYEHTIKVAPDSASAQNNFGILLLAGQKYEAAAEHLREAVHLDPGYAKPYNELGKAYLLLGKMDDAMLMFSNASRLNPGLAQARWNLGNSYLLKGNMTEGLAEMKAGVELSPDDVEAHDRFGNILMKLGKATEAAPYFEKVVKAQPGNAHAHFGLATAYLAQKRSVEAIGEYKEAIRLSPETPDCLNALAWIYATSPKAKLRNGVEAVRLAEKACALSARRNAGLLDTLAAAYAEMNQFEAAVRTATEARSVALAEKNVGLADAVTQRLALYQAGNPYREEP